MEPFNHLVTPQLNQKKLLLVSCSQAFVKHLISIGNQLEINTWVVVSECHIRYRLEPFFSDLEMPMI